MEFDIRLCIGLKSVAPNLWVLAQLFANLGKSSFGRNDVHNTVRNASTLDDLGESESAVRCLGICFDNASSSCSECGGDFAGDHSVGYLVAQQVLQEKICNSLRKFQGVIIYNIKIISNCNHPRPATDCACANTLLDDDVAHVADSSWNDVSVIPDSLASKPLEEAAAVRDLA